MQIGAEMKIEFWLGKVIAEALPGIVLFAAIGIALGIVAVRDYFEKRKDGQK